MKAISDGKNLVITNLTNFFSIPLDRIVYVYRMASNFKFFESGQSVVIVFKNEKDAIRKARYDFNSNDEALEFVNSIYGFLPSTAASLNKGIKK